MPRTAVTLSSLAGETDVAPAFAAFDNANGMYIAAGRSKGALVLEFKNTNAADRIVTVKAGVGGDAGPGFRSGKGDLAITVPLTSGNKRVVLRDLARFIQADGTINLDCNGANVTINANLVP